MDTNLRSLGDSIQRGGTTPPDAQEPRYREPSVGLNVQASEFVPTFASAFNPNASEFKVSSSEFNPFATAFNPQAPNLVPTSISSSYPYANRSRPVCSHNKMDANLRSLGTRRDSIQRVGTAPPDAQEPQYREPSKPLNVQASEFVPTFASAFNPNATEFKVSSTEFVPYTPHKEPPVSFNLSATATSFEPVKSQDMPDIVSGSTSANNLGRWSSPPSLGANFKPEVKIPTKGNEEAKDSTDLAEPDIENNPQNDSQNSSSQDSELKTEDKNDVTPENADLSPAEVQSVSNDSTFPINEESQTKNDTTLKVYSFDQIMTVAEEEASLIQVDSILKFSTRKIEREVFKPPGYYRHDRKKNTKHHDKKKPTIEAKKIAEELKDPEKWRFISEKQAELAQKAKETTQKVKAEVTEREKAQRQIKATLNKFTPSNFEKLKEQLLTLSVQDTENLTFLVQSIFQKAVTEIKYTPTYALLCKFLLEGYQKYQFQTDSTQSKQRKNNLFRRALLQLCQNLFEFDSQDEDFENLSAEEAQLKRDKLKKRILGNVRLIGELFRLDVIVNKIALRCIEDLIHPKIKDEQELDVSQCHFNEEKLEGAITLLMTGGKSFEKNSVISDTDKIFRVLTQISETNIVSQRIKFLILNAIDARKLNWVNDKDDLPKLVS